MYSQSLYLSTFQCEITRMTLNWNVIVNMLIFVAYWLSLLTMCHLPIFSNFYHKRWWWCWKMINQALNFTVHGENLVKCLWHVWYLITTHFLILNRRIENYYKKSHIFCIYSSLCTYRYIRYWRITTGGRCCHCGCLLCVITIAIRFTIPMMMIIMMVIAISVLVTITIVAGIQ